VTATEHELMRQVADWRTLLTRVADDLEHAASAEPDAKHKRWYESRATRIRQRLDCGVPGGWSSATSPR
jgi:hypothetical protein